MTPDKRVLVFFPRARDSNMSRMAQATETGNSRLILYLGTLPDASFEPETKNFRYRRVTIFGLLGRAIKHDPDVVELPEPLWLRYWPLAFALAASLKLIGRVRSHKPVFVAYAIENVPPDGLRFTYRSSKIRWVRLLNGIVVAFALNTTRVLDRICFGTASSRENYKLHGALTPRLEAQSTLIWALEPPCIACNQAVDETKDTVLFVGEMSERKGVMELIDAWESIEWPQTAQLVLAGQGPLAEEVKRRVVLLPNVNYLGQVTQQELHAWRRQAKVAVAPSRAVHGWSEQVGLPIVEALSHGLTVVTTCTTGLAPLLEASGHTVLREVTVETLAEAIAAALRAPLTREDVRAGLPQASGRGLADDFLLETRRK